MDLFAFADVERLLAQALTQAASGRVTIAGRIEE